MAIIHNKYKIRSVLLAILAAVFYAINTPFSKVLLKNVTPTLMASFLYLGAGIGVGILYVFHIREEDKAERLTSSDLPYTVGMIVLDIAAPIFLMFGIGIGSASNASLLGFVAYGLSIFMYIRAQRDLGAAKTSAYYAIAPFVGTFLAFVVNGERLTSLYFIGLIFMIVGTVFVILDTMYKHNTHEHSHTIVHTHNGITHTHVITHEHDHNHFASEDRHGHSHDDYINSEEHKSEHMNGK